MVPLYIISSPARLSRRSRATETTLFVRRGMKKWPEKRARPASCPVNSVAGSHIAGSGRVGGGSSDSVRACHASRQLHHLQVNDFIFRQGPKERERGKSKGKKKAKSAFDAAAAHREHETDGSGEGRSGIFRKEAEGGEFGIRVGGGNRQICSARCGSAECEESTLQTLVVVVAVRQILLRLSSVQMFLIPTQKRPCFHCRLS